MMQQQVYIDQGTNKKTNQKPEPVLNREEKPPLNGKYEWTKSQSSSL